MAQATVYEVAEKAGVSISTVSRVLNAPDKVNPVTRARVLTVIDELGFVPKAEAAVRARKDLGRIGVLAPFFTYPSFVERMRGVAVALADLPYELAIYSVDSSTRRDTYLSSLAVARRLDGMIVMALPFGESIAERLISYQLETVLVEFTRPEFSSIESDNRAGGRMAAEYLLRQGHTRLGFVGDCDLPDYAIHTSDWRLEGFRASLLGAGIDLPDRYIALAVIGQEPARRSAHRLFDLPAPPTAIFAASDTQAIGALRAARERNLHVPRDVAIMGFDDLDISDYIGLTTVRQPLQESGQVAVELLLARLASRTRSVQRVHLPLTLVQRETA